MGGWRSTTITSYLGICLHQKNMLADFYDQLKERCDIQALDTNLPSSRFQTQSLRSQPPLTAYVPPNPYARDMTHMEVTQLLCSLRMYLHMNPATLLLTDSSSCRSNMTLNCHSILPCYRIWTYVKSCHVTASHLMSFHVMSQCVTSQYTMSHHVTLFLRVFDRMICLFCVK